MAGKVLIRDGVWKRIKANLARADKAHVKVGILDDSDHDGVGMSELGAIHEYGSPAAGIPERSFIRRTLSEKEDQIAKMQGKLANAVVTKNMPIEQALDQLGAMVASEIKKTITSGEPIPPPLKPATIAAKGSDRPLVDTGRLVGSITHKVEM